MADTPASPYRASTPDPAVHQAWSLSVQRYADDDDFIQAQVAQRVLVTTFDRFVGMVEKVYNWGRRSSIWPMQFGLACCAIEMISAAAGRFDIDRFGAGLFRASPRQADLMIVSGTVSKKMLPQIVRLWDQMPEPKYCLSMGACATGGGPFKEGYNVISGIDKYLPVDVFVPGCPPTPQALLHGLITLQRKIDGQEIRGAAWLRRAPAEEVPVPMLGADLVDMRRVEELRAMAAAPAEPSSSEQAAQPAESPDAGVQDGAS